MEGGGAHKFSDKFYEKNIPIANMKEFPVLILEFCVTCVVKLYTSKSQVKNCILSCMTSFTAIIISPQEKKSLRNVFTWLPASN